MKEMMFFSEYNYTAPPNWTIENIDDGVCRASCGKDGDAINIMYYEIASGILMLDIDLACAEMPLGVPETTKLFTINWCAQGRCEVDFGLRGSAVVDAGSVCLSTSIAHTFSYPTGSYRGFECVIALDGVDKETEGFFESFGVSLYDLTERLCSSQLALTLKPNDVLASALQMVSAQLASGKVSCRHLLLSLCQLLSCFNDVDVSANEVKSSYLQRGQRDIARNLHDAIVADPVNPPNCAAIAKANHVSESTLRTYFQRVYGSSPAAFARSLVFQKAAKQIANENLSVSDIAMSCGYSNPSKFSAAFKRAYGVSPLEFRRRRTGQQ